MKLKMKIQNLLALSLLMSILAFSSSCTWLLEEEVIQKPVQKPQVSEPVGAPVPEAPEPEPAASQAVGEEVFKWFICSKTVDETQLALEAARDNRCGLLVYVAKPGCQICEAVWSKSHNGRELLDGDGKMAAWLKAHKIVGLKVDDSQSHFTALAAGAMGWKNPNGSATNTNAPFLVLVKPSASSSTLSLKSNGIEAFFGGFGSLVMYDKSYSAVTSWLDGILASSKYKEAF